MSLTGAPVSLHHVVTNRWVMFILANPYTYQCRYGSATCFVTRNRCLPSRLGAWSLFRGNRRTPMHVAAHRSSLVTTFPTVARQSRLLLPGLTPENTTMPPSLRPYRRLAGSTGLRITYPPCLVGASGGFRFRGFHVAAFG